jgi:hypothetical protein
VLLAVLNVLVIIRLFLGVGISFLGAAIVSIAKRLVSIIVESLNYIVIKIDGFCLFIS